MSVRVKTTCEVGIYELDAKDCSSFDNRAKVHSHWCYEDRVVLEIGGTKYTFIAADLHDAIRRASR